MEQRYPPIGDYALLADCHSAALVSRTGAVDWACLRRFDSSSVFGRILDWERGGTFAINPRGVTQWRRRYLGDSLVLETTAVTETGTVTITDAFAMVEGGERRPLDQLLRVVECTEGTVEFEVVIAPRFDYGELRPWLRRAPETDDMPQESAMGEPPADGFTAKGVYSAVGGNVALTISAELELDVDQDRIVLIGGCSLSKGQRCRFSVVADEPHDLDMYAATPELVHQRLADTIAWWDRWSSRVTIEGPHAQLVRRSAVVLKGLTCAPTGAIVAAPTTSLPEEIGGVRNWDYRYSWVRDSTLALSALCLTGHPEVAQGFRDFLLRSAAGSPTDLQIMYGIYGERHLPEYELNVEGYRGSRPARVGNGAASQRQLDVYGHVLDAAHLWRAQMAEIAPEEWRFLRGVVDRAIDVIDQPDHGIWEIRGEPRHFVHSKVMLWVAVDRGIDTVEQLGLDEPLLDRWREARERIRELVWARGIDAARGCFVQAFDSGEVDAALLRLPSVGFVDVNDPVMKATVDAIQSDLAIEPHGFLVRYRPARYDDGLPGEEGTFLLCSFWLVDVLAMQGRLDEARALFERLVAVGNDLSLFAEEYDPSTGEQLGNFPQAFTHMALIHSAHQLALAADRGEGRSATWEQCRTVAAWTRAAPHAAPDAPPEDAGTSFS